MWKIYGLISELVLLEGQIPNQLPTLIHYVETYLLQKYMSCVLFSHSKFKFETVLYFSDQKSGKISEQNIVTAELGIRFVLIFLGNKRHNSLFPNIIFFCFLHN